jgi:GxxExxY protein
MQGGDKFIYKDLSYKIVGILYEVYNELGYGYKEIHYERAVEKFLKDCDINYARQSPYKIRVGGEIIGRYYMDFIVDSKIVLELKQGNYFSRSNIKQVERYLIATNLKLGIIANFTSNGVRYYRVLNPNNIK